jgi:hypothetical protein
LSFGQDFYEFIIQHNDASSSLKDTLTVYKEKAPDLGRESGAILCELLCFLLRLFGKRFKFYINCVSDEAKRWVFWIDGANGWASNSG